MARLTETAEEEQQTFHSSGSFFPRFGLFQIP